MIMAGVADLRQVFWAGEEEEVGLSGPEGGSGEGKHCHRREGNELGYTEEIVCVSGCAESYVDGTNETYRMVVA